MSITHASVPSSYVTSLLTFPTLTFAALSTLAGAVVGQESRVPFDISTDEFYVVQDSEAQLYEVEQNTFSFGTINQLELLPGSAIEVNNLGLRSTDGFLYGIQVNLATGENVQVVQIDSNGTAFGLGRPEHDSLPIDVGFNAGDISSDGTKMYLSHYGHPFLYILDLTKVPELPRASSVPIDARDANDVSITDPGIVLDWAFNHVDHLLYGGDRDDGEVAVLDPRTGIRRDFPVSGLPSGAPNQYGGAWFDAHGDLFLLENSGKIYQIDVSDLSNLQTATPADWLASIRNDAAASTTNCANDDGPLEWTCDLASTDYTLNPFSCPYPSPSSNMAKVVLASSVANTQLDVYFYELTSERISIPGAFPSTGTKFIQRFLGDSGIERGRRESTMFDDGRNRREFFAFDGQTLIDTSIEQGTRRQCVSDGPATSIRVTGAMFGADIDIDFSDVFLDCPDLLSFDPDLEQSYTIISATIDADLPSGSAFSDGDISDWDFCFYGCIVCYDAARCAIACDPLL